MPQVTLTLTDTPEGVVIHLSPCILPDTIPSPAEFHALQLIAQTHKIWSPLHIIEEAPAMTGVDMDAIYHNRPGCTGTPGTTDWAAA